jgi:hypothetical protein
MFDDCDSTSSFAELKRNAVAQYGNRETNLAHVGSTVGKIGNYYSIFEPHPTTYSSQKFHEQQQHNNSSSISQGAKFQVAQN